MSRFKVLSPKTAIIGLCVFFLVSLLVLVNLSVRMFIGDSVESISYTDLQGATFLKGDLWLDLEKIPGLTHLVYRWCPGLSPLNWCVDLQHTAFAIKGQVAVSDLLSESKLISVSDMDVQSVDMSVLGFATGLVDARINGRIDAMAFSLSGCPMKSIEAFEGQFKAGDIQVFGISAGAHQIRFTGKESVVDAQLSGDTFLGRIQLSNGQYSAEGEMTAPETIAGMAQSFMRPLGDNRFGWEISGDLPC